MSPFNPPPLSLSCMELSDWPIPACLTLASFRPQPPIASFELISQTSQAKISNTQSQPSVTIGLDPFLDSTFHPFSVKPLVFLNLMMEPVKPFLESTFTTPMDPGPLKTRKHQLCTFHEHEGSKVCFSLGHWRPDEFLDDLLCELQDWDYEGAIWFDFLGCNGFSRRFFKATYASGSIKGFTHQKPQEMPQDLVLACNRFYQSSPEILAQSVLSHDEQEVWLGMKDD